MENDLPGAVMRQLFQGFRAGGGCQGHKSDPGLRMRFQVDFLRQRHDRVGRPAPGSAGKSLAGSLQHARAARCLCPAQESRPVALVLAGYLAPKFDQDCMDQYHRFFVRSTRPALEHQCIFLRQVFTLDKKFVEGRMAPVDRLRRQYHFAVTGHFQPPGAVALVQDIPHAGFRRLPC